MKCPTCGKGEIPVQIDLTMQRGFETELHRYIFQNPDFKTESCFICVEKHVSTARQFEDEMLKAQGSGTSDGKASINIYEKYLSVLGELNLAAREAKEWPELHALIVASERSLRYSKILVNWRAITDKMLAIAEAEQGEGLLTFQKG